MKFSIVLPTYNRAHVLKETVHRLYALDFNSKNIEILIVNNNSSDDTADVVKQLQRKHPALRYLFEKKQGRTFASITGMTAAAHKKIIFIDDDIAVQPDLLHVYERAYQNHPNAAVIGGPIKALWTSPSGEKPLLASVLQRHEPWIFGEVQYGPRQRILKYPNGLFAGNMSINLEQFTSAAETFCTTLGRKVGNTYLYAEDFELCLRLQLNKKKVVYEPALAAQNLVDQERATNAYLLQRLINSGCERYLVDQELLGSPTHTSLIPSLVHYFMNFLKTRTRHAFFELMIILPIRYGYSIKGPRIARVLSSE